MIPTEVEKIKYIYYFPFISLITTLPKTLICRQRARLLDVNLSNYKGPLGRHNDYGVHNKLDSRYEYVVPNILRLPG